MQACLLIGLLGVDLAASAADGPAVPLTGRRVADFVPTGWRIEQSLGGDLNADQRPDSVLVLVEKPREEGKNSPHESRARALVVLLALSDGLIRRVGLGWHALYCTHCFGDVDRPIAAAPTVLLKDGRLSVVHWSGLRWKTRQTQLYRYERLTGRMRLDYDSYQFTDTETRWSTRATTDFITDQQHIDRSSPNRLWEGLHRSIRLPVLYLEEVNIVDEIPFWLPVTFWHER